MWGTEPRQRRLVDRVGNLHPGNGGHPRSSGAGRLAARGLGLIALAGLWLSACASPPDPKAVWLRFADDPADIISWTALPDPYLEEEIFHWRMSDAEELSHWQARDMEFSVKGRGIKLHTQGNGAARLWREQAGLNAEDIHTIEVKTGNRKGVNLALYWAAEGERFDHERRLVLPMIGGSGDGTQTYSFEVNRSASWTGTIDRLRLDPEGIAGRAEITGSNLLFSIRGLRRSLSGEALGTFLDRPALHELNGDSRLAYFAPPGFPLTREASSLPAGSTLRFAYGLQQDFGAPVTFRVLAQAADGEPSTLFETTLDPANDGGEWLDGSVDLQAFQGSKAKITLISDGPAPDELLNGLPMWGHPEVLAPADGPQPPNVVLIVADTLRADRTSLYGHDRDTTPNLNRWAAERGQIFENVVAAAPWTLPSHASLFTGLNALRHGANYQYPADDRLMMLAEVLRAQGYTTAAFTGGGYLSPGFGLTQGFDRFQRWRHPRFSDDPLRLGSDIEPGVDAALRWIEDTPNRPFFLFFHTYEVHAPFHRRQPWYEDYTAGQDTEGYHFSPAPEAPSEENHWLSQAVMEEQLSGGPRVPLDPDNQPFVEAIYDSGINKMDREIGRLLDRLKAFGLEKNTLVVFTSDHGEGLGGKHEKVGHHYLYDYNVLVPLVVSLPGGAPPARRIGGQVGQVDIMPTILEALGLRPDRNMDGESLMPLLSAKTVGSANAGSRVVESFAGSTQFGFSLRFADRWKWIAQQHVLAPLRARHELFDLQDDPLESRNMAALEAERAEDFEGELHRRWREGACYFQLKAANRQQLPFEITIKTQINRAKNLGGLDHLCADCVTYAPDKLTILLKQNSQARMALERSPTGRLQADVRLLTAPNGRGPKTVVPELGHQDLIAGAPYTARLAKDASWQFHRHADWNLDAEGTGLQITWQGRGCPWVSGETQGSATSVVDEETRKQLEALGYIDN